MKTNTLTLILAVVAFGGIALIATTKIAANPGLLAVGVSYTAVALLVAMAISDNRASVRDYAAR